MFFVTSQDMNATISVVELEHQRVDVALEVALEQVDVPREQAAHRPQLRQQQHDLAEVAHRPLLRLLGVLQRLQRFGDLVLRALHLLAHRQVVAVGREEDQGEQQADLLAGHLQLAHPAVNRVVRAHKVLARPRLDEVRLRVLELLAPVAAAVLREGRVRPDDEHLQAAALQQEHLVGQAQRAELGNALAEVDDLLDAPAHDVAEVVQHVGRPLVLQVVEAEALRVQQALQLAHLLRMEEAHALVVVGRRGFRRGFNALLQKFVNMTSCKI